MGAVKNLAYSRIGKEVLAIHNERFKGITSIEDNTSYSEGQPLSYSNVPRVLSYDQILMERFPHIHILNPVEVVQYWDVIPERDETYADTNSIPVFPNEGFNEGLRKRILTLLGRNKIGVPLVISGLDIRRADNEYGFTFERTDYTKVREAPYLQRDGRVSFDGRELVQSEKGVKVLVPENQAGLLGLFRVRSLWLGVRRSDLFASLGHGRVQVFCDSQDFAGDLEDRV